MKRFLKRSIMGLLYLVSLLSVILPVGLHVLFRDLPVQNYDDMAVVRRNLPPEENAFTYISLATNITFLSYDYCDLEVMMTNGTMNADIIAELISSNQVALANIERALTFQFCEVPEITSFDTRLPYLAHLRNMGRLMSLQCHWLFQTGQEKQAFDKSIDIIRFGNMVEDSGGGVINELVGMAIKSIGLNTMEDMIPLTSLPSDDLVQYARTVSKYPSNQVGFANAFRVEYKIASAIVDNFGTNKDAMKNSGVDGMGPLPPKTTSYLFQPNRTKKDLATDYRSMIAASSRPFYDIKIDEVFAEPDDLSGFSMLFRPNATGRLLRNIFLPALGAFYERKCQEDLQVTVLQTLLALKAYRNDHSKLPERLKDLVPDYLSEVPVDPYDGKQIRYIKDRQIIYSVGKNLNDDNGSDKPLDSTSYPSRRKAEDFVFSIAPSENTVD